MIFLERQGFGDKFMLEPNENTIRIGRGKKNQIIFNSTYVSRTHCEIIRVPPHGTLILKHCTDTTKTYVDEIVLSNSGEVAELTVGCLISLGVPLDMCKDQFLGESKYVFLKVCQPTPVSEHVVSKETSSKLDVGSEINEDIRPSTSDILKHPNSSKEDSEDVQIIEDNSYSLPPKTFKEPKIEFKLFPDLSDKDHSQPQCDNEVPETKDFLVPLLREKPSNLSPIGAGTHDSIRYPVIPEANNSSEISVLCIKKENVLVKKENVLEGSSDLNNFESTSPFKSNKNNFKDRSKCASKNTSVNEGFSQPLENGEYEFRCGSNLVNELEKEIQFQAITESDLNEATNEAPKSIAIKEKKEKVQALSNNNDVDYSFILLSDSTSSDDEFIGAKNSENHPHGPYFGNGNNMLAADIEAVKSLTNLEYKPLCEEENALPLEEMYDDAFVNSSDKVENSKFPFSKLVDSAELKDERAKCLKFDSTLYPSKSSLVDDKLEKAKHDATLNKADKFPIDAFSKRKIISEPDALSSSKRFKPSCDAFPRIEKEIISKTPIVAVERENSCVESSNASADQINIRRNEKYSKSLEKNKEKRTEQTKMKLNECYVAISKLDDLYTRNGKENLMLTKDIYSGINPNSSDDSLFQNRKQERDSSDSSSSSLDFIQNINIRKKKGKKPKLKKRVYSDSDPDSDLEKDGVPKHAFPLQTSDGNVGDTGKNSCSEMNVGRECTIEDDHLFKVPDVKKEPNENVTVNIKTEPIWKQNDDDDNIFPCYSQIDEVILLSSDEEQSFYEEPSNSSVLNICTNPPDDDVELPSLEDANPISDVATVSDINMEKFNDDMFITKENLQEPEPIGKDCKTAEDSDDEWWPALSQDFLNESQEEPKEKSEEEEKYENLIFKSSPKKDLKIIISKINNKMVSKSKFVEPQKVPSRTKADTIRKKPGRKPKNPSKLDSISMSSKEDVSADPLSTPSTSNEKINFKIADDELDGKESKTVVSSSSHRHKAHKAPDRKSSKTKRKSKSPDIREKLMKSHNFDAYKHNESKKKLHLVNTRENENSRKEDQLNRDAVKTSVEPRLDCSSSSVSKGKAKITKVSRNQKLTEIDVFGPAPKVRERLIMKFKIPKKTVDENSDIKSKKDNAETLRTPSPTSSLSVMTEKMVISNEVISSEPCQDKNWVKGILRLFPKPRTIPRNRVRFPSSHSDLVKIKYIPLETRKFVGPKDIQVKEMHFTKNKDLPEVYHPFEFISTVCKWNFDWLVTYQECRRRGKPEPPKVCETTAYPTITNYILFKDYKQTFSTLIYYEAWENVYKDWDKYFETAAWFPCEIDVNKPTNFNIFKFNVVKAVSLITGELSFAGKHPGQGSLIVMKHIISSKVSYTLGYVNDVKKRRAQCVPHRLRNVCQPNANVLLIFEIYFSKLKAAEGILAGGPLASIAHVSYIRPSLRAFECLCRLRESPLSSFILQPENLAVLQCEKIVSGYLIHELPLNREQEQAVIQTSSKCFHEPKTPKIGIIHGPPGTGKTRLIIALIAQIIKLFKESEFSSNRRILLCAPSNAAVDELVVRLARLKALDIKLNIVRVGIKQNMALEAKDFHVDVKTQHEFEKQLVPNNKSIKMELRQKEIYAEEAVRDFEKANEEKRPEAEIKEKERRMIELVRAKTEFAKSCKPQLSNDEVTKLYDSCRKMVLMKAEIIATTLTSCLSGSLTEVFREKKDYFSCCIVDEAGQCKETETWFPLQLGIKKLILVGDHMQLSATVLSQLCQGKKLHQSLFERIYHHIGIELKKLDVFHNLTLQYRMHDDILSWPSKHFYNNHLVTAPGINNENSHALKPYLVFDILDSIEERCSPGEIFNMTEVLLITSLIEAHEKCLKNLTVGVITPYLRQKNYLLQKLAPFINKYKITVSTVDNFQGQEKDVIYCSFVRSNAKAQIGFVSNRQRLNVALTRARKSCFIVGNLSSLRSNEDWKSLYEDARERNLLRTVDKKGVIDKKRLLEITSV